MTEDEGPREPLARRGDPWTSHASAYEVDLRLKPKHWAVHDWLWRHGYATDDEMAHAAVAMGVVDKLEQGRRIARTLREHHGLIVAVYNEHSQQITKVNESGRHALCWQAKVPTAEAS